VLLRRFAEHLGASRQLCSTRCKGKIALDRVPVISIIDDDAAVRAATDRLVRSLGYVAHSFASAEEFLTSPQGHDTSCVIADVQMPGMSGIELQTHLLAQGRRLPIIFITAFPEEDVRTKALNAGAVCFLTKPFRGATLIEHLDAVLNPQRGEPGKGQS
jgi:FixJ family two-component response regulator